MACITKTFSVGWADTDAGGAAHFTHAFLWAERVEHQLLVELGVPVTSFPRRKVECEYLSPLTFGDVVTITLELMSVGESSVSYRWTGRRRDELTFHGETLAVHVVDGVAAQIPPALRSEMAATSASDPVVPAESVATMRNEW